MSSARFLTALVRRPKTGILSVVRSSMSLGNTCSTTSPRYLYMEGARGMGSHRTRCCTTTHPGRRSGAGFLHGRVQAHDRLQRSERAGEP
eukprot:scaffold142216_cov78-Phaeocystis_antarctica.AAC.1